MEHLHDNIEALSISLSPEQIKFLEDVNTFDPGFPSTFVGNGTDHTWLMKSAANYSKWPLQEPIRPTKQ